MPRPVAETAAVALIAGQAAWAAAGAVFPGLPGWTMFSRVERARAELVDRDGRVRDLFSFVPPDVYVVDAAGAAAVAAWVCRAEPARAPWTLRWEDGRTEPACAR